jgi:dUTP pyrophosphatase
MILKVKKLSPDAILPSYAHPGDAGMDIYANETVTVKPGQAIKIKTGIAMEIPDGYVGLMWDKSGVAFNHKLKTLSGVIDSGYRGESLVSLINLGTEPYIVEKGHKIVQMLIQKVERVKIIEADELSDTSRGNGGFGSTGKK